MRPQTVGVMQDADECRDEKLIELPGGHTVPVPCARDEVLTWFR